MLSSGAEIYSHSHRSPLMLAAYEGNIDMTEYLLSREQEVNSQDHEGNTALMFAVYRSGDSCYDKVKTKFLIHVNERERFKGLHTKTRSLMYCWSSAAK